MIIKMQSILFPFAAQRDEKKPIKLSKKDRVNADRVVMLFLFFSVIVAAIALS